MKINILKPIRKRIIDYKLGPTREALSNSQNLIYEVQGPVLKYNQMMAYKRQLLSHRVQQLITEIDSYGKQKDELIYLTLMYFSSIGAQMVKKADVWLKSWGEDYIKYGYKDIGENYVEHAKEEVGHDKWHEADVINLVKMYNRKFDKYLDTKSVLNAGHVKCVSDYTTLSEKTITGPQCYLSLSELYETEIMAMDLAPNFIAYCVAEVGFEILKGLKFLNGHVIADVEHIEDNIIQMDKYLRVNSQSVSRLATIGEQTIDIYEDYFVTALDLAKKTLKVSK